MLIDVGIAASKNQSHRWWPKIIDLVLFTEREPGLEINDVIVVGAALTDFQKNEISTVGLRRMTHTDMNRSQITARYLDGRADAIFWVDDDTAPPMNAIKQLASLNRPIAAGLYFLRRPPHNPIAYLRVKSGGYVPLWNYQRGEIVTVDSVGMGCTLIRREVYEEIRRQYLIFKRALTGTIVPIHRDDVGVVEKLPVEVRHKVLVSGDGVVRLEPLIGPLPDFEAERWPFYGMEYGRTEDHWFCEMARRCGFSIVVDTGVECKHWGDAAVTVDGFMQMREWYAKQKGEAQGARA